jgi:hypothetical protein
LFRTTHASDFPEIVVNNDDGEHSEFSIIEIRQTSRPGEIWGRSEMEGTLRKGPYAALTFTVALTRARGVEGHRSARSYARIDDNEDHWHSARICNINREAGVASAAATAIRCLADHSWAGLISAFGGEAENICS